MGTLNGRKIYISTSMLEELKYNINDNINFEKFIIEKNGDNGYRKQVIKDCENLLAKLDKYKKVDENNRIYYYLFPSELETIMWILLENNIRYRY